MISDERLDQFAHDKRMCNVTEEIVSMAKELQAYRQAFSEPAASVYFDSYYGYQASFANPTKLNNGEFLYRKPNIPDQEI